VLRKTRLLKKQLQVQFVTTKCGYQCASQTWFIGFDVNGWTRDNI